MNAPFLKDAKDGVYLAVKVQPRASRQQLQGIHGSELKVSVTAPPVDAAANDALIEFFAELLDLSRGQVQIAKGQTSRHKLLFIRGPSAAQVLAKLQPHLGA